MKQILIGLLLLLVPVSAFADSPKVVVVPPPDKNVWTELKADKGHLITLEAAPASNWQVVDDDVLEYRVFEAGKYCTLVFPVEGKFKLLITNPAGGVSKVIIIIGDIVPPVPPVPPVDALKLKLLDAFNKDTGTDKLEQLKDIALLYSKLSEIAKDKTYVKASDFLSKAHDVADNLLGANSLIGIRTVVKEELSKIFPIDGQLTDAQRVAAATLLDTLSKTLTDIANGVK